MVLSIPCSSQNPLSPITTHVYNFIMPNIPFLSNTNYVLKKEEKENKDKEVGYDLF